METEVRHWLDIRLNFSSETKFEIPSCNHVTSVTGRTVYFTGGRTDYTGTETDRRHEANQTEMTATTSVVRTTEEPADPRAMGILAMAALVE